MVAEGSFNKIFLTKQALKLQEQTMLLAEETLNEALETVPAEKIEVCKEVLQIVYQKAQKMKVWIIFTFCLEKSHTTEARKKGAMPRANLNFRRQKNMAEKRIETQENIKTNQVEQTKYNNGT